jgi:hypothetical protein
LAGHRRNGCDALASLAYRSLRLQPMLNPTGNPMHTIKPAGTSAAYTLAAATTEIMWACAFATARVSIASTARSLELWSQLLGTPMGLATQAAAMPPSSGASATERTPSGATAPAGAIPFASYRSSSGHAAAQVTPSE